jgi:hypothetical protein
LITKVKSIVRRASDDNPPDCVEIEVQTPLGRGVLHMSHDAASDLGAKLATHFKAQAPA